MIGSNFDDFLKDEIISRTDSQNPPSVANMVSSIRHKIYELTKAESEG